MYLRSFIGLLAGSLLFASTNTKSERALLPADKVPALIFPVASNNEPLYALADISSVVSSGKAARLWLGLSKQGRRIDGWFFPGTGEKKALVIGGVHGSELSSIEVALALVAKLAEGKRPLYSVLIIPSLFPDNAAAATDNPAQVGNALNIGRYSHAAAVDPNRQMPTPGKAFAENTGTDHIGRIIERENQLLLQVIDLYRPSRIANVHSIRNCNFGGIYADPRTDHLGLALGYATDSSLAVEMARHVARNGGNVNGNRLHQKPNALYYKDPAPARQGDIQKRNMTGSSLTAHRGSGVSLGTWATTAIAWELDSLKNREAMRVITLEFPGAKRPIDYSTEAQQYKCSNQVNSFAGALYHIFLGNYFTETFSGDPFRKV